MWIIWGKRVARKKLGRVADYCIRCQDARAFHLFEHRRYPHIYFIPVGRGETIGYTARCETCRDEVGADRDSYRAVERDAKLALEDLCDRTHPALPEKIAARLDTLDRVTSGVATPEERMVFITEALAVAAAPVQARAAETHIDGWSVLAFLGVFFLPPLLLLVLLPIIPLVPRAWEDTLVVTMVLGAIAVAIALLIYMVATDARRFYRRRYARRLLDVLAPLAPTEEELHSGKEWLKARGFKLHKWIDPLDIVAKLRERADQPRLPA